MLSMPPKGACGRFAACAFLLGGNSMPAANSDADQGSSEESLDKAISHLVDALQILDTLETYPEAAARLQWVIDLLKEDRSD